MTNSWWSWNPCGGSVSRVLMNHPSLGYKETQKKTACFLVFVTMWPGLYVCMYVCMYICVGVYIYTYIHTYFGIYIYIDIHTYIHIYIYVCICICICIYMHINVYIHTYVLNMGPSWAILGNNMAITWQ